MKIVEVEWVDSSTYSGWQDVKPEDFEVITAKTVGYLVRDDEDMIVLAQSKGSGEPYCNVTCIPRVAMRRFLILRTQEDA